MRVLCLLALSACVGSVPSRYEVRDLRVISVVADHPEVSPGDTVTLTAYFEDPLVDASGVTATMQQCPDMETQERDISCVGTSSVLTLASEPTAPALDTPNVFSAQFSYTEPATLLEGLSPLVQSYGYYDQILFHGQDVHRGIDASKRVVVTPATVTAKNQNPVLLGFTVADKDAPTPSAGPLGQVPDLVAFARGHAYTLQPLYDASSLESYSVKTYTGQVENFTEEATFVWSCAQSCTLDRDTSYSAQTVTLTIPSDWNFGDSVLVNVVMRDGRGGEVPFVRRFGVLP